MSSMNPSILDIASLFCLLVRRKERAVGCVLLYDLTLLVRVPLLRVFIYSFVPNPTDVVLTSELATLPSREK